MRSKPFAWALGLFCCLFLPILLSGQASADLLSQLEKDLAETIEAELPDFAPTLYAAAKTKLWELRALVDAGKEPEPGLLREARQSLNVYRKRATEVQKVLSEVYPLRNVAWQLDFIRQSDPAGMEAAEAIYRQAIRAGEQGQQEQLKRMGAQSRREFEKIALTAQGKVHRSPASKNLEQIKQHLESDLQMLELLGGPLLDPSDLEKANGVVMRSLPAFVPGATDLDGDLFDPPPYYPPLPPPVGPQPPFSIDILERDSTSIRLSWTDVADGETGHRLLRWTNTSAIWQVVEEWGPQEKFSRIEFEDTGLRPDTRYGYWVESYDPFGTRSSPVKLTYTLSRKRLPLWRLQLQLKVADAAGAGIDNPLRILYGNNGQFGDSETFLNYSHDDFETGSDFTYDLILGDIKDLGDLTNLAIVNYGGASDGDHILIDSFTLLANGEEVYGKKFGNTASSALRLAPFSGYSVDFLELRAHREWSEYIRYYTDTTAFGNPPVVEVGGEGALSFDSTQIGSRIESYIGHLMYLGAGLPWDMAWGDRDGPQLRMTVLAPDRLHVYLNLKGMPDILPDPQVDIEFDIFVSKSCGSGNELRINLTMRNFTTNVDYELWEDIASASFTYWVGRIVNYYAQECLDPPVISEEIRPVLDPEIDCEEVEVYFNAKGDLLFCCRPLGLFFGN